MDKIPIAPCKTADSDETPVEGTDHREDESDHVKHFHNYYGLKNT